MVDVFEIPTYFLHKMLLTYDIFKANFYIIRKQQYQLSKTRVINILKVMNRLSRKCIFRIMFENCAQSESIHVGNCCFYFSIIFSLCFIGRQSLTLLLQKCKKFLCLKWLNSSNHRHCHRIYQQRLLKQFSHFTTLENIHDSISIKFVKVLLTSCQNGGGHPRFLLYFVIF